MLDKLANALRLRGFLIQKKDDHIYIEKGNPDGELFYLEEMFRVLGISIKLEDRNIYLLDDHIEERAIHNIIWYKASNHEAGGGSGWSSWKYFIKRNHGPKINTFVLETGVALLVKALSAAGIVTICSCDGHGKRSPFIAFCGRHNAIWFSILLNEVKDKLKLNYEWYFHNVDIRDVSLVAKRKPEGWDLDLVLEDTVQMADYFLAGAASLSKLKREVFGGNYKTTRKTIREMDYEQLSQWMNNKYQTHLLNVISEVKVP
ncbi:hypothetical protein [Neobacillus niacini]|uniref:hypothetical protein n=1 Tax=Neobacillus niacini TaxID=86668 RepID=UPI0021CAF2E6|nr:hypothetical protein [Neobacillus niacini]MCM3767740.1 hypothetical protein [Neobacillus niacini]